MCAQQDELFSSGNPISATEPIVEPNSSTRTKSHRRRPRKHPPKSKSSGEVRPTRTDPKAERQAASIPPQAGLPGTTGTGMLEGLGEVLDQVVPVVFQHIDHAEALSAEFTEKYPEHAQRFRQGFKYLGWSLEIPVADTRLYRVHVTELLQRVVDEESWQSATGAEVLSWLLKVGLERRLDDAEVAVAVWLCELFYGVSVPPPARPYVPDVDDATLRATALRLKAQLAQPHRDIPLVTAGDEHGK